jgi:Zn-dependent alcohol dehydrogenase
MKAAILEAFDEPFLVEEVELLPPEPHDVIVRTSATVFCITDCINQHGGSTKEPPYVTGHSAVGVIEEVGSEATLFRPGDRVIVPAGPECGTCYWCTRDRPDQCAFLFAPGPQVATRADGRPLTILGPGTYAEQMKLPQVSVFPIESDLPDDVLALMGCGVVSGLGAVFNVARVEPGSSVVVLGCGHLGLWMIQGAKVAGADRIIGIEPRAERRAVAMQLGATDVVDPGEGDPVSQVQELTRGRGADYALEAAGSILAMQQAFDMCRNGGVVVYTGIEDKGPATRAATIALPAVHLALRGRDLRSSQSGRTRMRRDVPRFVTLLEEGLVDPYPVITSRYSLDEINECADASDARRDLSGVLMMEAA